MIPLLVALTALEAVIALIALVVYVNLLTQRLRVVTRYLGKISMGVRAVDTQTSTIGPSVTKVNEALAETEQTLQRLVSRAA